eukprot:314565-Chlamydomonas_euryale.AAC.1
MAPEMSDQPPHLYICTPPPLPPGLVTPPAASALILPGLIKCDRMWPGVTRSVMLVGLGGNNGTTLLAGVLANKQ